MRPTPGQEQVLDRVRTSAGPVTITGGRLSGRTTSLLLAAMEMMGWAEVPAPRIWLLCPAFRKRPDRDQLLEPLPALRTLSSGSLVDLCRGLTRDLTLPFPTGSGEAVDHQEREPVLWSGRQRIAQATSRRDGFALRTKVKAEAALLNHFSSPQKPPSKLHEKELQSRLEVLRNSSLLTQVDLLLRATDLFESGTAASELVSRCAVLLVDDLSEYTQLEQRLLRSLRPLTGLRVFTTADSGQGDPGEVRLPESFSRGELLVVAQLLFGVSTPPRDLLPFRGFGGRIHRPLNLKTQDESVTPTVLADTLAEFIGASSRAGRSVGVVAPQLIGTGGWLPGLRYTLMEAVSHLDSHSVIGELIGTVPVQRLAAALRFVCGLSDFSGGHPLLNPGWLAREDRPFLDRDRRREAHLAWQARRPLHSSHPLSHDEVRLRGRTSTSDVLSACFDGRPPAAGSPARQWALSHPDPPLALTVLTALQRRPQVAVRGPLRAPWDDLILIMSPAIPAAEDIHQTRLALLNTRESFRLILVGDRPTAPNHLFNQLQRLHPAFREITQKMTGQESFPPKLLRQYLNKHFLTPYLTTLWADHVRQEVFEDACRSLGTDSRLLLTGPPRQEPSRAWQRDVTLLKDYGLDETDPSE